MTSDAIEVGVVAVFANEELFFDDHNFLLAPAEMLKAPDSEKGAHCQTQIEHQSCNRGNLNHGSPGSKDRFLLFGKEGSCGVEKVGFGILGAASFTSSIIA
jgi:hypothetical protein